MTSALEGWPANAKEIPSPHEVRLAPLDTNPVFQCLGDKIQYSLVFITIFACRVSLSNTTEIPLTKNTKITLKYFSFENLRKYIERKQMEFPVKRFFPRDIVFDCD